MNTPKAYVKNGRIVVDAPTKLEGEELLLCVVDPGDDLSDEQRRRLDATLKEGFEHIKTGNTQPVETLFAALDEDA